jgi:hypothetical protein
LDLTVLPNPEQSAVSCYGNQAYAALGRFAPWIYGSSYNRIEENSPLSLTSSVQGCLMAKVILRQKAIDYLNDIWDYTFEQWPENQADKYYGTLKSICKEIGTSPDPGENMQELKEICLALNMESTSYFTM